MVRSSSARPKAGVGGRNAYDATDVISTEYCRAHDSDECWFDLMDWKGDRFQAIDDFEISQPSLSSNSSSPVSPQALDFQSFL